MVLFSIEQQVSRVIPLGNPYWRLLGPAAPETGGRNPDLGFRLFDFKGWRVRKSQQFKGPDSMNGR
jgi:hypothetical protein